MESLRLALTPRSAFGTRLRGDTLFGQLCWEIRYRFGSDRLADLLDGYTAGRPFAVVSDAMPSGYVPRPIVPLSLLADIAPTARKAIKKRVWIPVGAIGATDQWLSAAHDPATGDSAAQPHNSISRLTGTTGPGEFAPYQMEQIWYAADTVLDCYVVYDPERITARELEGRFNDMGGSGFGRDATIGLGRFDAERTDGTLPAGAANPDGYLTLAPCVPQGEAWRTERCFYHPFTRFGRHGGPAAVLTGGPFKTPLLMADSGAALTPQHYSPRLFVGRGLGGDGSLSKALPETVHQGYAPVIGITLPSRRTTS